MPALDNASSARSLSVVTTVPADPGRLRIVDGGRDISRVVPWRLAVSRALGAVVVTVEGVLDRRTSAALGRVLADLIDGQGNLFVIVDLRRLVVDDSASLRVLTRARCAVEARSGRFLLAGSSPRTAWALRAAGLGAVIELHPERRHHPSAQ
jgi:anti-anti-sigma factor